MFGFFFIFTHDKGRNETSQQMKTARQPVRQTTITKRSPEHEGCSPAPAGTTWHCLMGISRSEAWRSWAGLAVVSGAVWSPRTRASTWGSPSPMRLVTGRSSTNTAPVPPQLWQNLFHLGLQSFQWPATFTQFWNQPRWSEEHLQQIWLHHGLWRRLQQCGSDLVPLQPTAAAPILQVGPPVKSSKALKWNYSLIWFMKTTS